MTTTGARRFDIVELVDVAHGQVDEMFDLVALLKAGQSFCDPERPWSAEDTGYARRLFSLAEGRSSKVIAALTPYV